MEQYVNIRLILDRILRHPLLSDVSLETAVDYTLDFMRIIGMPKIFKNKIELVPIKEHRGLLPCDWYNTIQIKDTCTHTCLRYATDSFHESHKTKPPADLTYTIQGNIIYTSFKNGEVEISYEAFPLDKEGLLLIPDSSHFLRALELYIKKQVFTILFDLGKISAPVLQNTIQEYSWAAGAAQNDMVKLDLGRMESLSNSWKTLIIRNEFRRGFKNDGVKEMIRVQP